ncbi:flagellar hook-basal body protein [Paenibacillus sp. MBLB4367]|uniref:flagellar hook-basal body protein n=1 Tax=Paenibacillus sp. MBLB4367 TaxID=3384767 RepID=UPI003908429F
MNNSMINSMVTLHALQQKLDIVSNNMANVNTVGYKRREATFEDILNNIKQQPAGFQKEGRLSPLGFNQGWGAKLSQVQMSMSQGAMKETGTATDIAIEGEGLFEVVRNTVDENGNALQEALYTRDGAFDLIVQPGDPENRYLATKEGYHVRDTNDQPITVPIGFRMAVDTNGDIRVYDEGNPSNTFLTGQRVKLMRAVRPQYLQQIGDNLFVLPQTVANGPAAGQVIRVANNGAGSGLETPITVRQGFLEQSNVNMADEMTELMMVQRAFQMGSRAITSSDTMMNLANNLRG